MSRRYHEGRHLFVCDGCGLTESVMGARGDMRDAWYELDQKGWRTGVVRGTWQHRCPECAGTAPEQERREPPKVSSFIREDDSRIGITLGNRTVIRSAAEWHAMADGDARLFDLVEAVAELVNGGIPDAHEVCQGVDCDYCGSIANIYAAYDAGRALWARPITTPPESTRHYTTLPPRPWRSRWTGVVAAC